MADVKGNGRQAVRFSMEVFLRKAEAPVIDVFESKFESIEDSEMDGGKSFGAASEPGLVLLHFKHIVLLLVLLDGWTRISAATISRTARNGCATRFVTSFRLTRYAAAHTILLHKFIPGLLPS